MVSILRPIVFLLGFAVIVQACESSAPHKNDTKILRGEWLLDSIKGERLDELDWVYFLDGRKFYRFSDNAKNYVLDSSLNYDSSFVYRLNKKAYAILSVDSSKLILEDSNNRTLIYKKWRKQDLVENVDRFLSRVPYKKKINGYWEVVSFERPSEYYDEAMDRRKLEKGNILSFSDKGIVRALKSLADTTPLFEYSYRIFPDEIDFIEYDMVMGNKLIELNDSTLIFDSRKGLGGSLYKLRKLNVK